MLTYSDIHTHNRYVGKNTVLYNLKLTELPDKGYSTFGIHPWELGKISIDAYLDKLHHYCQQRLIVAVGEIGIDRAIKFPIDQQIACFEQQHAIASTYKLPVIIHCVKAWSDLLAIKNRIKPNVPWIFHGYNGNASTAQQLINKGCYLSFGQQILRTSNLQEVFKELPLNKLFLETDDSHEKIETIYQKATDLRHISILDLKIQLEKNFNTVFK